jgi:hypothetical protein
MRKRLLWFLWPMVTTLVGWNAYQWLTTGSAF